MKSHNNNDNINENTNSNTKNYTNKTCNNINEWELMKNIIINYKY